MLRRNFIGKITIIFFLLLFSSITFAQGEAPGESFDIANLFNSISVLTAGVLIVTAFFKRVLKTVEEQTLIVSGIVSLALSAIGFFLQAGIFEALEWYYIFIIGAVTMAIANELTTWPLISGILTLLRLKVPNFD